MRGNMHGEVARNPEVVNKLILIDMLTLDEVTIYEIERKDGNISIKAPF